MRQTYASLSEMLKLQYAGFSPEAELCENDTSVDVPKGSQTRLITDRPLYNGEKFTLKFSEAQVQALSFGLYEPRNSDNLLG